MSSCSVNVCLFTSKLVKLAKKLKKEKVNIDIVNFGEDVSGTL